MPGYARKDIIGPGEIAAYHTWSRCVQRAVLCGQDPVGGKNFEHRRVWIQFSTWFHHALGSVEQLGRTWLGTRRRWIQGIRHCGDVFT
jgi:hypothetical protein